MTKLPHFVLFSRSEVIISHDRNIALDETGDSDDQHESDQGGSWYFRILTDDGQLLLEASDVESNISRDRLELLSVVRGLEALEQPSDVTLVVPNPQISRAVRQGLDYWRDRNWMWERFGEKVPMRNSDMWKRIDAAIQIHAVQCRTHRVDPAATLSGSVVPKPKLRSLVPNGEGLVKESTVVDVNAAKRSPSHWLSPVSVASRFAARKLENLAEALQSLAPDASPEPRPTL